MSLVGKRRKISIAHRQAALRSSLNRSNYFQFRISSFLFARQSFVSFRKRHKIQQEVKMTEGVEGGLLVSGRNPTAATQNFVYFRKIVGSDLR
jgi:hypothetical protein